MLRGNYAELSQKMFRDISAVNFTQSTTPRKLPGNITENYGDTPTVIARYFHGTLNSVADGRF